VLLFDLVRVLARPAADAHATARLYIDLASRMRPAALLHYSTSPSDQHRIKPACCQR
jgi:hypothetical protein